MATTKITLKRLQETTVEVEYDEAEYQEWLIDSPDTPYRPKVFVRSHQDWMDQLDELLSSVRESDWKTVDSGVEGYL